jgi:hypothetical protein
VIGRGTATGAASTTPATPTATTAAPALAFGASVTGTGSRRRHRLTRLAARRTGLAGRALFAHGPRLARRLDVAERAFLARRAFFTHRAFLAGRTRLAIGRPTLRPTAALFAARPIVAPRFAAPLLATALATRSLVTPRLATRPFVAARLARSRDRLDALVAARSLVTPAATGAAAFLTSATRLRPIVARPLFATTAPQRAAFAALFGLADGPTRARGDAHLVRSRAQSQETVRTFFDHRDHRLGAGQSQGFEPLADGVIEGLAFVYRNRCHGFLYAAPATMRAVSASTGARGSVS